MAERLDIRDIRKMSDEQILDAVDDNRQDMWQLRLDEATGELKDVNLLKVNRRNLARLKTVLHERQLASQVTAEEGSTTNG